MSNATPVSPRLARALLEHIETERAGLRSAVESVPASLRDVSPGDGVWSVAGIIQHLAMTEDRIADVLGPAIDALPVADVSGVDAGDETVPPPGPLRDRRRRVNARESLHPRADVGAETAWAALERSRVRMRDLVTRAAGRALREVTFPHPFLGPIDLVEWIATVGHHEGRHADQIHEVAAQIGVAGSTAAEDGWLAGVDHLVFACAVLEEGVDRLESLFGVRAGPGGRHLRWGTHNALLGIGRRSYIEVIAPDPDRASDAVPTLFGLDRIDEPRLVGWAAGTHDFTERTFAATQGESLGAILEGRRDRPDGSTLSWRMTDPETVVAEGILPFFVDWGQSRHPAADAPRAGTLTGLRATHPRAGRVSALLAGMKLPMQVEERADASLTASFDTIRGAVLLR